MFAREKYFYVEVCSATGLYMVIRLLISFCSITLMNDRSKHRQDFLFPSHHVMSADKKSGFSYRQAESLLKRQDSFYIACFQCHDIAKTKDKSKESETWTFSFSYSYIWFIMLVSEKETYYFSKKCSVFWREINSYLSWT